MRAEADTPGRIFIRGVSDNLNLFCSDATAVSSCCNDQMFDGAQRRDLRFPSVWPPRK